MVIKRDLHYEHRKKLYKQEKERCLSGYVLQLVKTLYIDKSKEKIEKECLVHESTVKHNIQWYKTKTERQHLAKNSLVNKASKVTSKTTNSA